MAKNRGRFQGQGDDGLNISAPWAWNTNVTKTDGFSMVDQLVAGCNPQEYKIRDQAFAKARRFVKQAPLTGVSAGVSQTWHNRGVSPKYARVDLEVKAGTAFVG